MAYPIIVKVRYAAQAYSCRFPNGKTASSTMSAQTAVERLMDKVWRPGTHRATEIKRCSAHEPGEFEINPIEREQQANGRLK